MSDVSHFITVSTRKGNFRTRLTKVIILFFQCSFSDSLVQCSVVYCSTNYYESNKPKAPCCFSGKRSIFSPNPANKQTCRFDPPTSPTVKHCAVRLLTFPHVRFTPASLGSYLMPISCCWIFSQERLGPAVSIKSG